MVAKRGFRNHQHGVSNTFGGVPGSLAITRMCEPIRMPAACGRHANPMRDDAPLQALMLPLSQGSLAWPRDGGMFLNARTGHALFGQPLPGLVAQQSFKPEADALERDGIPVQPDIGEGEFDVVLLLPPRQREARQALFAKAIDHCREGGVVVASVANAEGAKSAEKEFKQLAGIDGQLTKHHCRVFWGRKDAARIDTGLLARWREADAPRRVLDPRVPEGGFTTRPGVFAWDRVDPASALLAGHLPNDLAGEGADLGAGWGFLAGEVLRRSPGVRGLDLHEADARALDLARANLASKVSPATLGFHWHDVTTGLPKQYDFIVSNPPFHAQGRADRPELGQRFIEVAARALRPRGRLFLVANRHLPYEQSLRAGFADVRVLAEAGGFKVIAARRGR